MADHNIDINIKDTTSAKSAARPSAGGKVTTQLEPASIQKLEKAYEKVVLKAFNFDKISDSIAKEISKIMSPAKGQKSEGLSKGDLDRVVRDATSTLTKQLQQFVMGSLSKIASSASPGGLSDKKIVDVISGLDKHIQEAVKDLGRQIEKKTGRAVGPENAAAISKGVTDIIQKAIPTKELDAAARELSNAVGSIKGIVKEIGSIATSIGKMRSSGGGVDITEIKPMLQSLKRLFSEADNLGTAIKQGRDSAKGLVKAEKDAYIELSKALTDVKRAAREKVTRVKEQATGDPQQFAKTVSKELQKLVASVPSLKGTQLDKSISGLGTKVENLSDVADAIKDLGKEIKNQIQIGKINSENTKSLVDAMGNLNANLQDLPKTFGNKSTDKVFSGLEKFTSKTEELLQTVKVVLDETDIKKQIESAAKGAKIEVEADVKLDAGVLKEFKSSFDKIVQDLTKKAGTIGLYPSMDLESKVKKFKSAFEEGKPGAVRNIALDIQKMPEAKEFSSALKTFADDLALGSSLKDVDTTSKKIVASEKKFATEVDKTADTLAATRGVMDALKKREEKRTMGPLVATRSALESYNIRKYSGKVIPPGELEFSEVEKTGVGFGKKAEGSVKKNVEELAKSLKELQDYMVSELEKQLEGGSSGWKIVRENSEQAVNEYFKLATGGSIGNIKSSGKQWAVQIANIDKIRKDLGKGFEAASPTKVVEAFKQSLIEQEVVGKSAALRPQSIAKWVKSASNETIKGMDTLSKSQQEALVDLKGKFKGVEASSEMIDAIKSILGTDKEIERVFRNTFATLEAERKMIEGFVDDFGNKKPSVIKTLSIPAAKLTETGATTFETAAGSLRALPKFATFKSGFEQIYDDLLAIKRLPLGETFSGGISKIGFKPTGAAVGEAEKLAKEMLKAVAGAPELRGKVTSIYKGAVAPRGLELEKAGVKTVEDLDKEVENVIKTFASLPEAERSIDGFIDSMNKVGISAYDAVKALDSISFENVYDVLKKVVAKPLATVGKEPYYERSVRGFEEASRQLEQLLPLIEPGRPRRGAHQEAVVQVMARTSAAFKGAPVEMTQQKDLIKDLNLRLGELVSEAKTLRERPGEVAGKRLGALNIPEVVKEISTLGIPEALASKITELRPGYAGAGLEHLSTLQASTLKMYTDNLRELSPFGEQFQNWARNIANTSNALASATDETVDSLKKFGGSVSGTGTEFPTLRTESERELISGGRYGRRGYGFNVISELRTTTSTFEDQVLISGKIADALTSVTKTLIQPGVAGRLRQFREETSAGVSGVEPKLLRDVTKDIGDVSDKIQDVLGIPERYKGRADRALIEEVTKAITVVRGKEVEVQAAKLAEVFLNYFGRKITTRYGSKGVALTPSAPRNMKEILEQYGEKKMEVLPKTERRKAGLGVAVLPKTIGQLAAELIESQASELESKGMEPGDLKALKGSLVDSGNRFIIDMFKQAGILAEDEIEIEKGIFDNLKAALKKLDIDLASDIEGISQIKEIHGKKVGKPQFTEKAIDVRISAYGAGKRGLQTEVLESVMGNIMGISPGGRPATVKPVIKDYEKLLKGEGKLEPGLMSKYAEALGFEKAIPGKKEVVFEQVKKEFMGKGIAEDLASRMAELEAISNYYVDVIDELSKGVSRKGLVGQKFVQIAEEPHIFEDWSKREVEKGVKGERLNLPAFGAYSAIFGEQSAFMEELKKASTIDSKEAWEYIKALQTINNQNQEFKKLLMSPLKTEDLFEIKDFTEATGTLEDFKDSILDVQKFPGPFKLKIPRQEKGRIGEYEELYVPGAEARGTYKESLVAGERSPKVVARRLANLVSAAKRVEKLRSGSAQTEEEISKLESQIAKTEDPEELEGLNIKLASLFEELKSAYAQPERVEATKREIVSNVGGMLKRVQELAAKKTGKSEIEDIISKMLSTLSETEAPPSGFRVKGVSTKLSEKQSIEKLLGNAPSFEEYADAARKMSDIIIGVSDESKEYLRLLESSLSEVTSGITKGPATGALRSKEKYFAEFEPGTGEFEKRLVQAVERQRQRVGNITKVEKAAESGELATLAKNLGVDMKTDEKEMERALVSLSKAKIDYYNTLSEEILGKGGGLEKLLLSRTIPAVMGKAIAATVDKTDDLVKFSKDLKTIYGQFTGVGSGLQELESISQEVLGLSEEHAGKIEQVKKTGIPVLKQHELGIPPSFAKKIPLKYTPKYKIMGNMLEEIPEKMREEVNTTLFDILKEAETLTSGIFVGKPGAEQKPPSVEDIRNYVEKELVPYIESVRYPFTGISSVQPYKAKLMTEGKAQHALAVPGMPEMDFDEFDRLVGKVKDIRSALETQREGLKDTTEGIEKRKELTSVIDELNKAISRVLPKYVAHEQKLDFDGDAIEIHSASTKEAREDIKKHFDSLTDDIDSTRAVFRDFFTSEARQAPSGKYVLGEMTKAYEKKFPFEKGFEFLKKPYLEKEMAAFTPAQQLGVLAGRPGARTAESVLKDVAAEFVRTPEDQEKTLQAIDATVDKSADSLIKTIEQLGGDIEKLVKEGVKTRSFEEKYKDAIEAQLYKVHTGPETEALYRLTRVVESFTGFGGGQIEPGAESRATEEFKKRWPRIQATGGKPEFEFQTMINELLRFGVQKGMDVKHAGELPVAGEIARELSKGEKAAERFFDRITSKEEESFKDLREFAEQNEIAIKRRLGRMPTGELRGETRTLRQARGMRTVDIEEMGRPELEKEVVGMVGFKGFLVELARQIREQAIEGLVKEMEMLPPPERARKTRGAANIRAWAEREISAEAAGERKWTEGINVKKHIIAQRQPLYTKRIFGAGPESELKKAQARGIEIPEPDFVFSGMSKEETKRYIEKYKRVQATAINLAGDLKRATEGIGGGAYSDMMLSGIQNIYDTQEKINKELVAKIGPEGFDKNLPAESLVERVLSGTGVADISKQIIGDPKDISDAFLENMRKQVESYSDLVGVGMLTQAEQFDVKKQALGGFRQVAEKEFLTEGVDTEKYKADVEKYALAWEEKAKALRQMDKVLETLKSKKHEPMVLRAILPDPEDLKKVTSENIKPFVVDQMREATLSRTEREKLVAAFAPRGEARVMERGLAAHRAAIEAGTGTGGAAGAMGGIAEGKCVPITNCGKPLDVFIVGASGEVKIGAADTGTYTAERPNIKDVIENAIEPVLKTQRDKLSEFSEIATGNLNKLSGATYETMYRASALSSGGMYEQRKGIFEAGGGVDVEKLRKSQTQGIIEQMLGLVEEGPELEASAFLGTALHSKIQDQLKKKFGEKVEFEKFVKYEDDAIGLVAGHIDAAFKNAAGNIERVSDIKTVNENIVGEIGRDVIDLDAALSKGLSAYARQKLEAAASQINLYLAAIAQQEGTPVENLTGEAKFYSRLEPEKGPATVTMKFDPERLKSDLSAVAQARELINKYIFEEGNLEELSLEYKEVVESVKKRLGGKKPGFAPTASLEELENLSKTIQGLTEEQIADFAKTAKEYYTSVVEERRMPATKFPAKEIFAGRERVRQEKNIREAVGEKVGLEKFEAAPKIEQGGDLEAVFKNLVSLHEQAKAYQDMVNKLDFDSAFKGLSGPVKDALKKIMEQGRAGGASQEFAEVVKTLQDEGAISFQQSMDAWKLYRIALGDFFIKEAAAAKKEISAAGDDYTEASKAYGKFQAYINRFKESIVSGLGKKTDIYAPGGQFVSPELARGAGVYLEPKEIQKRAQGPLGEDDRLKNLFKMIVETEKAPVFKAREVISGLTDMDAALIKTLTDADLVKRKGDELKDSWNFEPLVGNITRLRAALKSYMQFNVRDDFTTVQKKNLQDVSTYLGQAEKAFSRFGKEAGGQWGQTGVTKVLPWLDPEAQKALHTQNIANLREYFKKTQEAGGPEVGDRFTYMMKILDQTGNVIKNSAYDFHKYGEFVNSAGQAVGAFTEGQRNLIEYTQGANRTFASALRRVVMWGGASTLVYGGVSQLKSMIGTISDIEMSIAQLRMVMSPLETDFDKMGSAAVGFAKEFGIPVTDVLKSMRIFAQQGLNMAETIERTRTASLAANVTTLNAKDATEALTAASKIFMQEGESTVRFIDAWSEVEAKHAVTSDDMAQGLRKVASVGKTAGFTFDELNGIIASIGSVTRQTGKEVGTSLRFMFRRLTTEKAPEALAKIGIPILSQEGSLRRGFDILSDLAGAWKDLTNAQKLNLAQAIGGTRQYNQLIVLMDNWQEALDATRESVNSTGSAQVRNAVIMKTYAKQLEQTKAAAVELQMAFGKIYLPIAKFSLKGMKGLLESITSLPVGIKAAAVGMALFVTYVAKGDSIINALVDSMGKGSQAVSEFFAAFKQGSKVSAFEVLGLGKGKEFEGLKGITEGKSTKDFHSSLGKTAFLISEMGKSWNRFLGDVISGTGTAASAVGKTTASVGKGVLALSPVGGIKGILEAPVKAGLTQEAIRETLKTGGIKGLGQIGKASLGVVAGVTAAVAGKTTEVVGDAIDVFGKGLGTAGQKLVKDFAGQNAGLVKATAPMIISFAALIPVMKAVMDYYGRITQSAQDYEEAAYGIRQANDSELGSIRSLIRDYDSLNDKLEGIKEASKPETKARRMELGTYESPLLALASLQTEVINTANKLAETNINLISGYDKLGNAVLRTVGNFKDYLKQLDKLKVQERARTETDVLGKYIEDLTQIEGPEKWKSELKSFIKNVPMFGDVLSKNIQVAPAKALDDVTKQLNDLIALKNKFPISTAFDKDIKKYQDSLKEIRAGFNKTYSDFKRVLSELPVAGLDKDDIANLFGQKELKKGYELMLEVEPRLQLKGVKGKVKWEDVLGAEVLRRVFPETAPVLDVTSALTEARLETSGMKPRAGKALSGDVVTFWGDAVEKYSMAGNQAILSLKETTDGVFEWVVTYFNTKTLKVEDRPFTENLQQLVDNVFPMKGMQDELSDRIEVFNEFVAGAAAGLRGISAKDFKREFGLGERFFSEIPTTTILQGEKGFAPGAGFGASPFQREWKNTMEEFFFKPMSEYKAKAEQLEKLRLEGLEGGQATLATGMYEELTKLQDVLKNNQVVIQYRAVFVDLTKAMEQSMRTAKENLAVEKDRLVLEQGFSGYMKGIPEGFDSLNTGVQRFNELTARQRAAREMPEFRKTGALFREAEIRRTATREDVYAVDKALVALESIRDVAKGFGATLSPEDLQKYTEVVARTGETGVAEMVLETRKVEKNTSETVDRLDRMLENMGDQDAIENMLSSVTDYIGFGLSSSQKTLNAMERVSRARERFTEKGNEEAVIATNKTLDVLVKNLVEQVGIKKAMEMVEDNTTLLSKKFTPEELAQRAFGGLDYKAFKDNMSKAMKEERRWSWRMMDHQTKPAFENIDELKKLEDLQKQTIDTGLLDSKNLIKYSAGLTAFQHFSKSAHNKTIGKMDEQLKSVDSQIAEAQKEGKDIEKLSQQKAVYEKAIEGEKAKLEFDQMVQSVAALSTGTMTLAKSFGLTEGQIKGVGGAAIGLYAAVKLVSSITGQEMPAAAKEFGNTLKDTMKKVAAGEDIGVMDARSIKSAGSKFMKEYGNTVKEGAEKFKEHLGKATGAGVEATPPGFKGTIDDLRQEVEKTKKEIGQSITSAEGTKRIRQLVLAFAVTTAAGYTAERRDTETRLATLNSLAEDQAEVFADIIKKYPEEAQKVIDQMKSSVESFKDTSTKAAIDTETKSLVLDTEKERSKITSDMEKMREDMIKEHEKIVEEMGKSADKLAGLEIAKQFEMEIEELNKSIGKLKIAESIDDEVRKALRVFDILSLGETAKYPGGTGKLGGRYRPQALDFGVRSTTEMTPEEYLVYKQRRIAPEIFSTANRKSLSNTGIFSMESLGSIGAGEPFQRLIEDVFKDLARAEEERTIKRTKLEEAMIERQDLSRRRGVLGGGLSAADEKRYELLGGAIDNLKTEVIELSETMADAKERLRTEVIKAQVELFEQARERDFTIARAAERTVSELKTGRGLFAGGPAILSKSIEFGPKTFKELSAYQVAYQEAFKKSELKVRIPGVIETIRTGLTESAKAGTGPGPFFSALGERSALKGINTADIDALRAYEETLSKQAETVEKISEIQKRITAAELDDDAEAAEQWGDALDQAKNELIDVTSSLNELSISAEKQIASAEKLQRSREMLLSTTEKLEKFNIARFFSDIPTVLNKEMRGFTGELALPSFFRDLSAQQMLFARGGETIRGTMESYKVLTDVLSAQAGRIEELVGLRDQEYQRIIGTSKATKEGRTEVEAATSKYKNYTDEISKSKDVYETLRNKAESMGYAIKNAADFMDILKSGAQALTDLRVSEMLETMPGVTRGREMAGMLYGGAHPLARQAVTPAEERAGLLGGVGLTSLRSTRYEKERAMAAQKLMSGEMSGQQLVDSLQELYDIPERQRRDVEAYNQSIENARINQQRSYMEQRLQQLLMFRETHKLEGTQLEAVNSLVNAWDSAIGESTKELPKTEKLSMIEDLMKKTTDPSVLKNLQEQYDVTKGAGEQQYMGLFGTLKDKIEQAEIATQKLFNEDNRNALSSLVTQPIVSSLEQQTEILRLMAKATGVSPKDLEALMPGLKTEAKSPELATWQKVAKWTAGGPMGLLHGGVDLFKGEEVGMEFPDYINKQVNQAYRFFKSPGKFLGAEDEYKGGPGISAEEHDLKWEQGDLGMISTSAKVMADSIVAIRVASERFADSSQAFVRRWTIGMFAPTEETANFAPGGKLSGRGGATDDQIPIWASNGEYVVNASAAKKLGYSALDYINKYGEVPKMQEGGKVLSANLLAPNISFSKKEDLFEYIKEKIEKDIKREEIPDRFRTGKNSIDSMLYGIKPSMANGGKIQTSGLDPKLMTDSARNFYETMLESGMPYKDIVKEFEGLAEPWIDPTMAFTGGFGGLLGKGLAKAAVAGLTSAAVDYPLGMATEKIGGVAPGLALPFNIAAGVATGKLADKAAGRLGGFAARLATSEIGSVGKDINAARKIVEQAAFFNEYGQRLALHPHAAAILESKNAEAIMANIPPKSKVLSVEGAEAVVFETPDGKVLRIGDLAMDRPQIPGVTQAEYKKVYGNLQVELMPKLQTEGITTAHKAQLTDLLNKYGYEFSDPHLGNIGINKKGMAETFDIGAIKSIKDTMQMPKTGFSRDIDFKDFDFAEADEAYNAFVGASSVKGSEDLSSMLGDRLRELMSGYATGGMIRKRRYEDGGGIFASLIRFFAGSEQKKDIDGQKLENLPLGTGMLSQTAEKVRTSKEEKERQLKELGFGFGGRIGRFANGGTVAGMSLGEAQDRFGSDVNMWFDWVQARKMYERTKAQLETGTYDTSDQAKSALRQMEINIQQAGSMLSGINDRTLSTLDPNINRDYSKIKMSMKHYANAYTGLFYKDLETVYGKNWLKRLAPNLVASPENSAALIEKVKNDLIRTGTTLELLPVPYTQAKSEEELKRYNDGGFVDKTGPIFAHAGEYVVPKSDMVGKTLNNTSSLEIDMDEIASKMEEAIKKAIESAEFPKMEVNTDGVSVPVNTEGALVGVDTDGVSVPIDATEAIANIEAAIKNASAGPGGAVGAEKMDSMEEMITKLDETVFNLDDKFSRDIQMLDGKIVDRVSITEMIKNTADPLLTEINRRGSTGDDVRRELSNFKAHVGARLELLKNHIDRLSTHVGGA